MKYPIETPKAMAKKIQMVKNLSKNPSLGVSQIWSVT